MAEINWQPIETAPHDGSRILVYADYEMFVVRWIDDWWHVNDNKHGPYSLRGPEPTHWMPLPEPPA